MSKKSENLSDLTKKDRNKRHSSPFINVVKGVFFVVRVTLVPVSYLSAPPAVHSYRVPGKFIRLVRIKQKFIRIAYLYSKCTDCRINHNITNLVCYTHFHWFFNPECQHIFRKQTGYICTFSVSLIWAPKNNNNTVDKNRNIYASLNQYHNTE